MTPNSSVVALVRVATGEDRLTGCAAQIGDLVREVLFVDEFPQDVEEWFALRAGNGDGATPSSAAGEWIMMLNGDERLDETALEWVRRELPRTDPGVTAVTWPVRRQFLGRELRHSHEYRNPAVLLRASHLATHATRRGIVGPGHIECGDIPSIGWWIDQQNAESDRAALADAVPRRRISYLGQFGSFCWRYLVRLGFADGLPGLIWHFLQNLWLPILQDVKNGEAIGLDGTAGGELHRSGSAAGSQGPRK